jgi:hypothetical protein
MLSKLLSNVPLRQTEKGRTKMQVFPISTSQLRSFPAVSGSFSGFTAAARRGSAGELLFCKMQGKIFLPAARHPILRFS